MDLPKLSDIVKTAFEFFKNTKNSILTNINNRSRRKISRSELKNLVSSNVCEIIFLRRTPERAPVPPRAQWRRMLCTNSIEILNSTNGKISLNFRFPKTPRRIDEVKHNIVVAWDIIMQDYRNISMENCYLIQTIPGDETFWKYYNEVLYTMTPAQKMNFMDT
jgi:hypothetical protein